MRLKPMDCIVEVSNKHTELWEATKARAYGWTFLCSHISVERFLSDDLEMETPSRKIVACPNEHGVNFYAK